MGFGSLFRSLSTTERRPDSSRRRQQQSPHQLQRSHSVHGRRTRPNAHEAMVAYQRAKDIYEGEAAQLSRVEAHKRNQNDLECKRHMDMIDRRMRTERMNLGAAIKHDTDTAVGKYRAGRISAKELERTRQKILKKGDEKWTALTKWQTEEQAKAQRIFFARGEEIAESTGAALRRARTKMERNQRVPI